MNWSYQGTKACTVLVGDNPDSKSMSSEMNKTSSPSSTTSSSRTKQQSSASGGMSPSHDRILGSLSRRKRRHTFNQHDSHQVVISSESEVASNNADLQSGKLINLHVDGLGKVVHVPSHEGVFTDVGGYTKTLATSTERTKLESQLITPSETGLFVNVSDHNPTNSNLENSSGFTFTTSSPFDNYPYLSPVQTSLAPFEVYSSSTDLENIDESREDFSIDKNSSEEVLFLSSEIFEDFFENSTNNAQENTTYEEYSTESSTDEVQYNPEQLDKLLDVENISDLPTEETDITSTTEETSDFLTENMSVIDAKENSPVSYQEIQDQEDKTNPIIPSGIWKETQDLTAINFLSDSPNVSQEFSVKSEELQQDYPQPMYNFGQEEEVKIIHLQASPLVKNKIQKNRDTVISNNVKMIQDHSLHSERQKEELTVITRENSDEEFLREFERRFHGTLEEDTVAERMLKQSSKNIVHEISKPCNTGSSDTSLTNQIPVSMPGDHIASSSRKLVVNVTIATENEPGSSSYSKPFYVVSVSVPTDGNPNHLIPSINISPAQLPPQSLVINDTQRLADRDPISLPPPPKPPASPPPIWTGGECECYCPCMDANDEWDNFSANTLTEQASTDLYEEPVETKSTADPSILSDQYTTGVQTTDKYLDVESTSESICSGMTPLPPEPTILILEGEVPFFVDPNPPELTFSPFSITILLFA